MFVLIINIGYAKIKRLFEDSKFLIIKIIKHVSQAFFDLMMQSVAMQCDCDVRGKMYDG